MDSLKITKIEACAYVLPTRRKFRWASLKDQVGGCVLVRIETDKGIVGYGEATPSPDWGGDFNRYGGETLQSVCSTVKNVVTPLLLGEDATNITSAHMLMEKYLRANSYVKCAIDIALYDIWGKATGQPVYKLLGGLARPKVRIAHMIGIMSIEEVLEEAKNCVADGVCAFQLKGGEDIDRDVDCVKQLRKAFGRKIWIRLDPNTGYGEVKETLNALNRMTEDGQPLLDMIEQPLRGLKEMAIITDKSPVKTVTDESSWNVADAFENISVRGSDAISIYIGKAGGFYQAQKIATLCGAYSIPNDTNGIESAVGNAANLHFALAQPSVSMPCVISINAPTGKHLNKFGGHFYSDDICKEAFPVADGYLYPLDKPGLGIEVDMAKVEKYSI